MSTPALERELIDSWLRIFKSQKTLADGALAQVPDDLLHVAVAPGVNSLAIIMRHTAGNMLSRWTDWLTTDGEKPGRNRDSEFAPVNLPRADVFAQWEQGWNAVFGALAALTPQDLSRTITIRGEKHSISDAVNRQISHYGYHVGQIHLIARTLVGADRWLWQTIAPGASTAFNQKMAATHGRWDAPAGKNR